MFRLQINDQDAWVYGLKVLILFIKFKEALSPMQDKERV